MNEWINEWINLIQFNSIYFESKQQTHLKTHKIMEEMQLKKQKPEECCTPFTIKNNKKANIKQRLSKHLVSMYME